MRGLATSLILSVFALSVYSRHTKYNGCPIYFDLKMEERAPVFLTSSAGELELAQPSRGQIRYKEGEDVYMACPGPKNTFTNFSHNETKANCQRDGTFEIGSKAVSIDDLLCKKSSKAEVSLTSKNCGKGGRMSSIGYYVFKKWLGVINICYNGQEGLTEFSQHYLFGNEINYASKTNRRPSFNAAGLTKDVPADVVYKQAYQKSRFNQLLKSAKIASKYITDKEYLVRGHLAPDADFLLSSSQFSTYFYLNVAPQWTSINNGNWKRVENTVRKAAAAQGTTFSIITGTHGTLRLEQTNITLYKNKIPVPEYMYKVVYNEESKKAIVFVVINNPFINHVAKNDLLCDNICAVTGWNDKQWDNIKRGYVICCEFKDFQRKVSGVTPLHVTGILQK